MTRVRRDDTGGSLVVVLIIVAVGSLIAGSLLSLSGTGIRNTLALRDHSETRYAADGAIQTAVNEIRRSSFTGASGQHCFNSATIPGPSGASNTLTLPNFYGADSAAVSCAADPSRVKIHCPSTSSCNRPGSAILTLGRNSEDGIHIEQPNGEEFRVHGGVFSNSNINVVNGTLATNSRVTARGACDTTAISSTPAPQCNIGTEPNPIGDDPEYKHGQSTVPAHRNVPQPECKNKKPTVVAFLPGYYDNAKALSDLMAQPHACSGSTWWFQPGVYYFDFRNSGLNPNVSLPDAANVWAVDSGTLVAGTPVNTLGVDPQIPGACVNPINNAGAQGVQFIFGGDSRIVINSAKAEICGSYSADRPPVAIYGLQSGTETPEKLAAPTVGVTSTGFTGATKDAIAAADDNNMATLTANGNNSASGTLTAKGFAPQAHLAGSVLTGATLTVNHRHTENVNRQLTGTIGFPANGNKYDQAFDLSTEFDSYGQSDTFRQEVIDLDVSRTSALATAFYTGKFADLAVELSADISNGASWYIDAVKLEITYVVPTFRAAASTDCTVATPYNQQGNGSACAVVKTTQDPKSSFYVQGTTYVPAGVVDISLNNLSAQVFRFGIIARSLWVKATGSFVYTGPVIEVPDDSPGYGFSLYLTAYVCPNSSTCAASGTPVTRARIAIIDSNPMSPTPGARQVVVLSWNSG